MTKRNLIDPENEGLEEGERDSLVLNKKTTLARSQNNFPFATITHKKKKKQSLISV